MDLALDLTRSSGRAAKAVSVEIVRELTSADLALLETERGIKPSSIKRLRDAHHAMARLIAQGLSGTEISIITGYSQSRISILKADPTFSDLVTFYKNNLEALRDAAFADGQVKMAAVRNDLIEELHDRVLDAPETLSTDQILDGIKVTSDRTGLGPQSKSTNVNVNVDLAARVAAGRQRVERLSAAPGGGAENPGQRVLPALTGEAVKDE